MKSFRVTGAGANLRYHDLPGGGLPLVFIHGLGCASSFDYPTVAADPALSGRRLLLIDLLGSGFSDRPFEAAYTIDDHAKMIARLVHHLSLESIDLFGHSMGGSIAIAAAASLADQVQHLVLAEPNLDPGGGLFSRRIASMSEAEYRTFGHADLIQASEAEGNDAWAASLAASSPHAAHRSAVSLVSGGTPAWREQLYALPMPRTVIFGSMSLPDPDVEVLARQGINVEIVPNAGHLMPWQNPGGLAEAIKRGLAL